MEASRRCQHAEHQRASGSSCSSSSTSTSTASTTASYDNDCTTEIRDSMELVRPKAPILVAKLLKGRRSCQPKFPNIVSCVWLLLYMTVALYCACGPQTTISTKGSSTIMVASFVIQSPVLPTPSSLSIRRRISLSFTTQQPRHQSPNCKYPYFALRIQSQSTTSSAYSHSEGRAALGIGEMKEEEGQEQEEEEEEEEYRKDPDTKRYDDENEWNAVMAAFQMYKAAYGDLRVPSRFVVPSMSPWPREAWDMKLGVRVAAIRATGRFVEDHPDRRQWLDDMGFLWRLRAQRKQSASGTLTTTPTTTFSVSTNLNNSTSPLPKQSLLQYYMDGITFDQVYHALATYKHIYCSSSTAITTTECLTAIPNSFTIPNVDPWPEITRGMPLGKNLPFILSEAYWGTIPGAKEALLKLGLDLNKHAASSSAIGGPSTTTTTTSGTASMSSSSSSTSASDIRYQNVYRALQIYKDIHGDLLVPQPFVVPSHEQEERWPPELEGLRLGARVNAIRSQGTFVHSNPQRKQQLEELGFLWENPIEGDQKKRGRKRKEPLPPLPATATTIQNTFFPSSKEHDRTIWDNDIDDNDGKEVEEDYIDAQDFTSLDDYTHTTSTTTTATTTNKRMDFWQDETNNSWRDQRQQQQQQKFDSFFDTLSAVPSTAKPNLGAVPYMNTDEDALKIAANLIRREPEPDTMQERSMTSALRAGIISKYVSHKKKETEIQFFFQYFYLLSFSS
jgi:hypothetical protein